MVKIHILPRSSQVVTLCSIANFINAADRVLMPIAIIPMTDEFKWNLYWQGWILSAFAVGYFTRYAYIMVCAVCSALTDSSLGSQSNTGCVRSRPVWWQERAVMCRPTLVFLHLHHSSRRIIVSDCTGVVSCGPWHGRRAWCVLDKEKLVYVQ